MLSASLYTPPMLGLIARRLLQLPLILAVIFAITFLLAWVAPGDPLSSGDARRLPPEVRQMLARRYHVDSPGRFLLAYGKGLVVGTEFHGPPDFGPSLTYRDQRVGDIIASGLRVSLTVGLAAIPIALLIGTAAGVVGALRPGSPLDLASLAVALVGVSLPAFVTGTVLLLLFAGILGVLPAGGWPEGGWSDPLRLLPRLILPALTLAVLPAAYIARLVRLGLADVMSSDFIRTARAKGLSQRQALFRHALKVAYLPVVSYLGPATAGALTGSFVVEKVFALPGLGAHFVTAVLDKDQFLILGIVLTYSTILVVLNLLVDIAYAWFDPRIAT